MSYYSDAQICLAGHKITHDISNGIFEKFCSKCGSQTITECPSCSTKIRGKYFVEGVIKLSYRYTIPSYCHNCGKPYPWTQARLDAAKELIAEMDELNPSEQSKFGESLPDIISDTPKTALAATRISNYLSKISPICKEGIKQLFFDITTEAAKKMIWP